MDCFVGESTRVVVHNKKNKVCFGEKGAKTLQNMLAVTGVYEDFVPIIQAINLADENDGLAMHLLPKMNIFKFIGMIYS